MSEDRATIRERHPLLSYIQSRGIEIKKQGVEFVCLCPLHDEKTPSFHINPEKDVFNCFGCQKSGSVIDLHAALSNLPIGAAMNDLLGVDSRDKEKWKPIEKPLPKESPSSPPVKKKIAAVYDYQDASGKLVYQVVRSDPKGFGQRKILPDGSFKWDMDGVERLPYHLPEILSADPEAAVFVVEGEKDVETLRSIHMVATCNPGGAGKWLPSFSQYMAGRRVYLVPDNDEAGQNHSKAVLKSIEGICKNARWIELPKEVNGKKIKDITDLREACPSEDEFVAFIVQLEKSSRLIDKGVDLEIYSMAEMEDRYRKELLAYSEITLDLKNWLPAMASRPLIPGDLLGVIAGTGQMKTACVQNILANNPSLSALYFQLEITETLMFERSAAISSGTDAVEVFNKYKSGSSIGWQRGGKFNNLLVCPKSGMSMKDIDEMIARSSAKFGKVPNVFVIDYIQLVNGKGSRYERVSDACEEAKTLAKKWNCIGIIVSQISRKKVDDKAADKIQEVSIHDGKESGSLENSCGLLIGIWKTSKTELKCRILKNTKGVSGQTVDMVVKGGNFVVEQNGNGYGH